MEGPERVGVHCGLSLQHHCGRWIWICFRVRAARVHKCPVQVIQESIGGDLPIAHSSISRHAGGSPILRKDQWNAAPAPTIAGEAVRSFTQKVLQPLVYTVGMQCEAHNPQQVGVDGRSSMLWLWGLTRWGWSRQRGCLGGCGGCPGRPAAAMMLHWRHAY